MLWLSLTALSIVAIITLRLAMRISRKWYPDQACVFGIGFFTAVALGCAGLFIASL